MTTLADLLATLRAELADQGTAQLWSDEHLVAWLRATVHEYARACREPAPDPVDDADPLPTPTDDDDLLVLGAAARAYRWLAGREARALGATPRSSPLLLAETYQQAFATALAVRAGRVHAWRLMDLGP